MRETFHFDKIITDQSFDRIGPFSAVKSKEFLNQVICSRDLLELTFSQLTFLNCDFRNVKCAYSNFVSSEFINCTFTESVFRKSKFEDCRFTACKLSTSEFPKVHFIESWFINCEFDSVDLLGTFFIKCELIQSTFKKIRFLDSVTMYETKIWNSKKCIEIDAFDELEKILKDLNLLISTDQDGIKNS